MQQTRTRIPYSFSLTPRSQLEGPLSSLPHTPDLGNLVTGVSCCDIVEVNTARPARKVGRRERASASPRWYGVRQGAGLADEPAVVPTSTSTVRDRAMFFHQRNGKGGRNSHRKHGPRKKIVPENRFLSQMGSKRNFPRASSACSWCCTRASITNQPALRQHNTRKPDDG